MKAPDRDSSPRGGLRQRWGAEWRRFCSQPAGRRFVERYEQRRARRASRCWWRRTLNFAGGGVLLLVGAFLTVAPGPAVLFFALGGLLIARESRAAARLLDWFDRCLDPVVAWCRRRWKRLPPAMRRLVAGCAVVWTAGAIVLGVIYLR